MNTRDKALVAAMRKAVDTVAALMNEAKERNIVMTFNIAEALVEGDTPRLEFRAIVDIKRIESL